MEFLEAKFHYPDLTPLIHGTKTVDKRHFSCYDGMSMLRACSKKEDIMGDREKVKEKFTARDILTLVIAAIAALIMVVWLGMYIFDWLQEPSPYDDECPWGPRTCSAPQWN